MMRYVPTELLFSPNIWLAMHMLKTKDVTYNFLNMYKRLLHYSESYKVFVNLHVYYPRPNKNVCRLHKNGKRLRKFVGT